MEPKNQPAAIAKLPFTDTFSLGLAKTAPSGARSARSDQHGGSEAAYRPPSALSPRRTGGRTGSAPNYPRDNMDVPEPVWVPAEQYQQTIHQTAAFAMNNGDWQNLMVNPDGSYQKHDPWSSTWVKSRGYIRAWLEYQAQADPDLRDVKNLPNVRQHTHHNEISITRDKNVPVAHNVLVCTCVASCHDLVCSRCMMGRIDRSCGVVDAYDGRMKKCSLTGHGDRQLLATLELLPTERATTRGLPQRIMSIVRCKILAHSLPPYSIPSIPRQRRVQQSSSTRSSKQAGVAVLTRASQMVRTLNHRCAVSQQPLSGQMQSRMNFQRFWTH